MSNNILHRGLGAFAIGKNLNWLPNDTFELWQTNMSQPDKRDILIHNGWHYEDSILYTINREGFRDISPNESFMRYENKEFGIALGCSCTFGIGLSMEQTWVHQLSKILGIDILNFGVPGAAPDTCFRLIYQWLEVLKPSFVIYVEPPGIRLEVVKEKEISRYNIQNVHTYSDFFKVWFSEYSNYQLNCKKNQLAIEKLVDDNGIKFHYYSVSKDLITDRKDFDPKTILARDFGHPGLSPNTVFAQRLAKDIS